MNIVALIPARGGSKRIPGKNIKPLGGKPLIQWTIEAAQQSGVFSWVAVSTEDAAIAEVALACGAVVLSRSADSARDESPDIQWVREVLAGEFFSGFRKPDAFAILRPTSPFRTADTIRRALVEFTSHPCDSLRAVEPVKQHPFKMWILQRNTGRIVPFNAMQWHFNGAPAHSCPTQVLPPFYAQNASLEIAWTTTVTEKGDIAGDNILPFFTEGWEGFDINTPEDWERAEAHANSLLARV
jgi:CMP-N,N'-diacetyllegionaminic acid synthase